MKETYVLSFSIARTGITDDYNTIGIAASVVDKNYNQLDSFEAGCYYNEHGDCFETKFDEEYKKIFWENKQELLNRLKYTDELDPFDREGEMIREFTKFMTTWELKTKDAGFLLEIVTDNPTFNAGFINIMISEHTNTFPLPFTSDGKSRVLLDTVSQQKGVLSTLCKYSIDPDKYSNIIRKIYNVNDEKYKSVDYLLDTVYNIAKDQQILNNIRDDMLNFDVGTFGELNKQLKCESDKILEVVTEDEVVGELVDL